MVEKRFMGNEKGKLFFIESGACIKNASKVVSYEGFYVCCNGNIYKKLDCQNKCEENCMRFTQNMVKENDVDEIKKDFKIEVWP